MFDYVADPALETGYLTLHHENKPFLHAIEELFAGGANAGVRVITRPHTMKHADFDLTVPRLHTPLPVDGFMLGSCGIPTVYRGEGVCNAVFGENARLLDPALLKGGALLDATSAVILTQRGIDVGLDAYGTLQKKTISFLCTEDPAYKSFITDGAVRALPATLRPDAQPLLFSTDPKGKETMAYRYENAEGQRFVVFLFEGESIYSNTRIGISGLLKNYVTQRVLTENLPWVARQPLPAYCTGNPELYLMCKKDADGLSVALFNCFADQLVHPVIQLGDHYSHIECVDCEAVLEGDKVTLTSRVNGFSAAAFRVYKS